MQRTKAVVAQSLAPTRFDSLLNRFVARHESRIEELCCSGMRAISSVIRGAWYIPDSGQLDLLFNSGRQYRYSGVPVTIARSFVEAPSKGRFYNDEIRNRFPCREIGGDRKCA